MSSLITFVMKMVTTLKRMKNNISNLQLKQAVSARPAVSLPTLAALVVNQSTIARFHARKKIGHHTKYNAKHKTKMIPRNDQFYYYRSKSNRS
jgi:hypothetical protein